MILNIGGKNLKMYNWNIKEAIIYNSENYVKGDFNIHFIIIKLLSTFPSCEVLVWYYELIHGNYRW
jgi:hypothetical protein